MAAYATPADVRAHLDASPPVITRKSLAKPEPAIGQWWALNRCDGVIVKMLPGGGGNLGIAVFEGDVPPAHVSTMMQFAAWAYLGTTPPDRPLVEAPCTCLELDGGVTISTGCARHDARAEHATAGAHAPAMLECEAPR